MSGLNTAADLLSWYGLNGLIVAIPMALFAWCVQAKFRSPTLSYLLWLLVLFQLATPALVSIPLTIESGASQQLSAASDIESSGSALSWRSALACIWVAGSASVIVWSACCVFRFNRLLDITSEQSDGALQSEARRSAGLLGIRKVPVVLTTSANVPPMMLWMVGRVRIYLPRDLVTKLEPKEVQLIMAHELGHVRLSHHLVRWFEWLVSVVFWWNPIAWWARSNLRINEELCCDEYVVSRLNLSRRSYARSLLSAIELCKSQAVRQPALATGVNGGGVIERRIKMLMSKQPNTRTARGLSGVIVACAAMTVPVGFTVAQDASDLEGVRTWLESGVNSALVTEEQAIIMLEALRRGQGRVVTPVTREAVLDFEEEAVALERAVAEGRLNETDARDRLQMAESSLRATTGEVP